MTEKRLEIKNFDPKELVPYVRNAKLHDSPQVEKLAALIDKFGFDQPIVVDKNLCIIKGHARREAALQLGLKKVPVVIADHLTEAEVMASRLADNKVAESGYDPELLKFDFQALQGLDFDMKFTAFDDFQIEAFLNPKKSEDEFTPKSHESVKERKKGYDESEFRQMILIMDPESYEVLMEQFAKLQALWKLETNLEVVQKLIQKSGVNFKKIKVKQDAPAGKKKTRKK